MITTDHWRPNQWNRLLSAASQIAVDVPKFRAHRPMLLLILELLCRLDALGGETISSEEKTPSLPNEATRERKRRRKNIRIARLDDLHERDLVSTDYRRYPSTVPTQEEPKMTLKRVLSAKEEPMVLNSSRDKHSYDISCRDEWATVRRRAYRKFLALFQKGPTMAQRDVAPWHWQELLQAAHDHTDPCLRLLLRMIATELSSLRICRSAWDRFVETKDTTWLRLYSEMVTEWSFFDEARMCWEAISPVKEYIMGQPNDEAGDAVVGSPFWRGGVLRCIGHILVRRSRLLQAEEQTREALNALATHLEIYFGESKWWFSDTCELQGEASDLLCTLQRLGILGVTGFQNEDDGFSTVGKAILPDHSTLLPWPYSSSHNVHAAFRRIDDGKTQLGDWSHLLTDPSLDNMVEIRLQSGNGSRKELRGCEYLSLMACLDNPDLLVQVFQFLSFADVVKCRQTCRDLMAFIDESNNLWCSLYQSHFRLRHGEVNNNLSSEKWKSLCMKKWVAKRSLVHRRNQTTGWKHRICPYVGCYHILKSERLEAAHYATHLRRRTKTKSSSSSI